MGRPGASELFAIAGGLLLATLVAVAGLGSVLERSRPDLAAALGWRNAEVYASRAEGRLKAGAAADALRLSGAALAKDPLDVHALRVRGLAYDALHRSDDASRFMTFAGELSWRDNLLQAWLVNDALRRADFEGAFRHADGLLRRRDRLREPIFSIFTAAIGSAAGADALIARLQPAPPWRAGFFEYLNGHAHNGSNVERIYLGAGRLGAPATDEELRPYLATFAAKGDFVGAQRALSRLRASPNDGRAVVDGGFEGAPGVWPFGWRGAQGGVQFETLPAPDRRGSALRVEWDGFTTAELMSQVLVLAPGPFLLAVDSHAEGDKPIPAAWDIRCAASGVRLAHLTTATSAAGWRRFTARFDVPGQACDAVVLSLTGDLGGRRETHVGWYDSVTVERETAGKIATYN